MLSKLELVSNIDIYECCQAMGLTVRGTMNLVEQTYDGLCERGIINAHTTKNDDYEAMISYLEFYSTKLAVV